MSGLEFTVYGVPAAQGSKRHVGNGVMIESSKKVKPWRQDVVAAARDAIATLGDFAPFTGPVHVFIEFRLTRPKSHYRANGTLKDTAPRLVPTRPDLSKLIRSTEDAMTTAGVWRDDCLAAKVTAEKVYAETPGAHVYVQAVG